MNFPDFREEFHISLTKYKIHWLFSDLVFPDFSLSLKIFGFPWLFPDLEKYHFSPDFSLTAATLFKLFRSNNFVIVRTFIHFLKL